MAVTVTDTRTTINQADSATNWTIAGGGTAGTSVFAEGTQAIISTINITTGQIYFTDGTSRNLSNTLIYIWADNFALKDVWDAANPPTAIHLGDGTDRISFKMSGSNRKVFAHLDSGTGTTVDWECLVLDGSQASAMNTAGLTTVRAGSFAGLNLSAITQMGVDFTTLSKGLGGGTNVAVDIIRIGNDGLIITGGTTGDRGTFLEIVNEDKSTADGKAHGIIREYTTGLYGLQGPLTFGSTTTATSWFEDTNVVLVYENRNISDDKYYFNVVSNNVGGANFILTNSTLTTAGPLVTCDFSDADIDTLTITGCSFRALGNTITFGNDAAAANHTITGNTFDGCGQINPGDVIFQTNTISSSTASATGSVLLDADGTTNWADLSFVSGGTGHAIYITAAGTYTFSNFTYSGYSTSSPGTNSTPSSGSTNAMVYNDSGGAVTINVAGGTTPTVRNGAGATTTVNNNVNVTVTVQDEGANPIVGAQVAIFRTSDDAVILASTATDASGEATTTFAASTGAIYIRVRQSTNTATFLTSAGGINASTEVITTNAAHSFVDGEAVIYSKDGGTAVVGLTEGDTYYVNSITSTTLSLHNSAADAISNTSPVNLSTDGTETHHLDPVRYYPASTVGSIGSTDFSVTVTMIEDTTVTG